MNISGIDESKRISAWLNEAYERMLAHFGPTHWWPGDTPFEIAIGAILTQNTAWTNVEKAIENLKRADMLSPGAIIAADDESLEQALRPSGYFRQKAKKLRIFSQHLLDHYDGEVEKMAERPLDELRPELLGIHGIGPETADDILLYACHKLVFVVDAYTRRILSRHGIVGTDIGYEKLRALFQTHLPPDLGMWQEYHGLIVYTGKDFCRTHPKCEGCPLQAMLPFGEPLIVSLQ